ncbi:MAG: fumarylacetoacetate hydrolase family protein [Phycisphaerae bacterium]|nr:fumarylacetoacetate hydrolase family protein [Phycisphaerae bacterium]
MRLVRWEGEDGRARWGREVDEGTALPIRETAFPHLFATAPAELPFEDRQVRIGRRLAPVDPPNIIAIGRNYAEHAREMKGEASSEEPLIFLKATTSLIGPADAIMLPISAPDEVDYEAELAVVIGRVAKCVSERDVLNHVFGYSCANDVSARDCQKRRDKQWARGKSFDTFCPIGPVLVTADELSPDRLRVQSFLNGTPMQDGNTSEMIFSVAKLIHFLSHQFTLPPGTVILTGTPAGVGSARTPPTFLKAGDVIDVAVEGIGRLSNRVAREVQGRTRSE